MIIILITILVTFSAGTLFGLILSSFLPKDESKNNSKSSHFKEIDLFLDKIGSEFSILNKSSKYDIKPSSSFNHIPTAYCAFDVVSNEQSEESIETIIKVFEVLALKENLPGFEDYSSKMKKIEPNTSAIRFKFENKTSLEAVFFNFDTHNFSIVFQVYEPNPYED